MQAGDPILDPPEREPGDTRICALALCWTCGDRYYDPRHPQTPTPFVNVTP